MPFSRDLRPLVARPSTFSTVASAALLALVALAAALFSSGSPEAGAQSSLAATDWPEFRGRDHSGNAEGASLPTTFNGEAGPTASGSNVVWKTPIPGLAHSSPIVVGDVIYVTTSVPMEAIETELVTGDVDAAGIGTATDMVAHSWRLYAVDKNSGEVLWHRVAKEGVPRVKRHVKASHASATPASDGEHVVVLFGSEGMYAYDLEGTELWNRDVGLLTQGLWREPDYEWGPASSPVIHDGMVILQNDRQADSELVAFDLATGDEVWRVARDEKPSWATPTMVREPRLELVLHGANWITAYDPTDGTELWRFSNSDNEVITPTPVVSGDQIVVGGGYPPGGKPLYSLRAGGSGDITVEGESGGFLNWKLERGSPYTPTPLIHDGVLYAVNDNGIVSAYDMATGERLYRNRLKVGAGYTASPVLAGGKLYFPSEDGDVLVVRAGREYELLAENPMGEVLMASPAISGDLLVIRGVNHLFGIRGS